MLAQAAELEVRQGTESISLDLLDQAIAGPLALDAKAAGVRGLVSDVLAAERPPGSVGLFLAGGRFGSFRLALVFGSGCAPSISRPKSAERSPSSRTFAEAGA